MEDQNDKLKIKPAASRHLDERQIRQLKPLGYLH